MKGVPCNRIAVTAVARDRHNAAIRNTVFEKPHGLAPATARFGAARIIQRAAILGQNQTKETLEPGSDRRVRRHQGD